MADELPFVGNYPNGRGNFSGAAILDRSGSFRESNSENRMFCSTPRGNSTMLGDVPPINQMLTLDPVIMGDQKNTRSGEIRRILGISGGSTAEDNSFKVVHIRPPLPPAIEELKRFKASVLDSSDKARVRGKKMEDHLRKLTKYYTTLNMKTQHQSDMMTNERTGSNLLKLGNLMQRNPMDPGSQRLEERVKGVVLNKRVRSSVAEIRAEGRNNNTFATRLPVAIGKDKEMLKDDGDGSELVDEKIRRLPAGGEGWDKKMKRKRSFGRAMDCEGELKRVLHHKLNNEPVLQSSNTQISRSELSNGSGCITKVDTLPPASMNARLIMKNEMEKVSLSRDSIPGPIKDNRLVAKGNNKLSMREENHMVSSSPLLTNKGKGSRGPRTGPVMMANPCPTPSLPRTPVSSESWEQQPPTPKGHSLTGANNRKRQPSPPPITQWGGQRPQKISRTRRTNIVSPVSSHDEMQISPEVGPSVGTNGLLVTRAVATISHQIKAKHELTPSPARLSESEESGAGENRENKFKKKVPTNNEPDYQNGGSPLLLAKKNKMLDKEENGDGVRRQGRTGRRGSSFSRTSTSPMREKLDASTSTKLVKSIRSGSDKNGSKTGRPPIKKLSDRKGTRLGYTPIGGSPECTGESDDDREELLAAANLACNSRFSSFHEARYFVAAHAYSSSFWKQMEPVFAPVSLEDKYYLNQQLKSTEELSESLRGCGSDSLVQLLHEDLPPKRKVPKESVTTPKNNAIPLYQRILSALITEDETDLIEDNIGNGNMYQNSVNTYLPDIESINRDRSGVRYQSLSASGKQYSCNEFANAENGMIPEFSDNRFNGPMTGITSTSEFPLLDCPYEQMNLEDKLMLELQSIGLYPEAVPDLADGEDTIDQDINKMQKGLEQQCPIKKELLNKLGKAIENSGDVEGRDLEKIAMQRLIELAYKKLLATKGSNAVKLGVPKVSKQIALGFMRRTLARSRKFEDTGKSCFSEPPLRDLLFTAPSRANGVVTTIVHPEPISSHHEPGTPGFKIGQVDSSSPFDVFETPTHNSDQDFAKTGPIINRGKKKEVLLDDVGATASLRATSALGNTLTGGTKGKRSDRERDKDKSSETKANRASVGNFKGERKIKSKPRQKSTSANGFLNQPNQTNHVCSPGSVSGGDLKNKKNNPQESSSETKENSDIFPSNELESIELGVGGNEQDFTNWFNFDEDNLQDQDLVGLQIPMDDLTELNMF
ncbi:hypothetical protein ACFE04_009263 [Oxalis oulophora]